MIARRVVSHRNKRTLNQRPKVEDHKPLVVERPEEQCSKGFDQNEEKRLVKRDEGLGSKDTAVKEHAGSGYEEKINNEEKEHVWKKIPISKEQLIGETDKSKLIALPENELYCGYAFWHPTRLIRQQGDQLMFSFNNEFVFKLVKSEERSKDEFVVIDVVKVGSKILEKIYEEEVREYWRKS